MAVKKLAVTGGPCAGKSSSLSAIESRAKEKGYMVFVLRECATDLMESGITPKSCTKNENFQLARMRLQKAKEKIYAEVASALHTDVLILCDRGMADGKAYMSEDCWQRSLKAVALSEEEALLSYDAVLYLTSAAVGAKEAYTCENNAVRSETAEEAALLDEKIYLAWKEHPVFCKVGCYPTFEEKKEKILSFVDSFLTI